MILMVAIGMVLMKHDIDGGIEHGYCDNEHGDDDADNGHENGHRMQILWCT